MKIRNGFVSNSSSSSFICEICNEVESERDATLDDFDMLQCEHGHVFHRDCIPKILKEFVEKGNEIFDEIENSPDLPGEWDSPERKEFYKKLGFAESEFGPDGIPQKYCLICNFVTISHFDLAKYVFLTNKNIFDELRKKFGSDYQEFKKEIKRLNYDQKYKNMVNKAAEEMAANLK